MELELRTLFEFQQLINDLQGMVVQARLRNMDEERLRPSIERIDKLIEIYQTFDRYYYAAHFSRQRILALEHDCQQMGLKVMELQQENEKLLKTINFK